MAESNEDETGAPGEVKDAFREALERKKKARHMHEEATRSEGAVHGAHGPVTGKRVHRRKSG